MKITSILTFTALGFLTAFGCLPGFAQGTAFTYQGQLQNNGSPASGTYNFAFSLFATNTGGSLIAGPVTQNTIVVTNGLFTVAIDFGPGVFAGATNWLQIDVETNGVGTFTTLAPRQRLTPAPYAIFAEGANATGLTGTIPAADLNGVNGSGLTGVALLAGGNTFNGNQNINGLLKISNGSGTGSHIDEIIGPGTYDSGEEHSINFDDPAGHVGSLILGYNGNGYFSFGNLFYGGQHQTGTKAFTVFGTGNVNIDPSGLNNGFLNNGSTNGSGLTFGTGSGEGIASKRTLGGNQNGLDFYTSYTPRMSILHDGFVGIGRQTPITGNDFFDVETPATTGTLGGMYIDTVGTGTLPFYGYAMSGSAYAWTYLDGSDGNKWKLHDSGDWITVTPAGNIGLGTTTPGSNDRVEVSGSSRMDDNPIYLRAGGDRNHGIAYSNTVSGITIDGPFIWGFSGGALGGVTTVNPDCVSLRWDWQGNVWISNNCSVATLSIRGGADLAEPFNISAGNGEVPDGSVMVIDEQNPGKLRLSDSSYDSHVAGVVSGANGVSPGIQMHQQGLIEGGKNVALTGRVYVRADASNGAIRPGDMLTTSNLPGRAMKLTDHARAFGAILGKAMTGLDKGQGIVLVLVTLQ